MDLLYNIALGLAPVLVLGSYGYTFVSTRTKAEQADVDDLQAQYQHITTRIDDIYKLLLQIHKSNGTR